MDIHQSSYPGYIATGHGEAPNYAVVVSDDEDSDACFESPVRRIKVYIGCEQAYPFLLGYCHPVLPRQTVLNNHTTPYYARTLEWVKSRLHSTHPCSVAYAVSMVPQDMAAGVLHPGKTCREVQTAAEDWVRNAIECFQQGKQVRRLPYILGTHFKLPFIGSDAPSAVWIPAVEIRVMETMLFYRFYEMMKSGDVSDIVLDDWDSFEAYKDAHTGKRCMEIYEPLWPQTCHSCIMEDVFLRIFRPLLRTTHV